MKKIKLNTFIAYSVSYATCSSTAAYTQHYDADLRNNELYNLINEIEYDDSFVATNTDLNWLTEKTHQIPEQVCHKITLHGASDNNGIAYEHEQETHVDNKRKFPVEKEQLEIKNENNCNIWLKRQKIVNPEVNMDTKHRELNLLSVELDNITNMITAGKYFPSCIDKVTYDYNETNEPPNELTFYNALICLIKNILYYRFNIAKFFRVFKSKLDRSYNKTENFSLKDFKIRTMITLCIQFAERNRNGCYPDLRIGTKEEIEECKLYESNYIKLLKNTSQPLLLYNSIEYKKIKEYNFKFCLNVNNKLVKTEFRFLSDFFKTVFVQSLNVFKYYNMFFDFLGSLYEISLIINNNLEKIQNMIGLDNTVFKITYCRCSEQTKQNFIFHWVICWITYFSTVCSTPYITNDFFDIEIINVYPKEFFVQCILLIHFNICYDKNDAWEKLLDKNEIIVFKETIMELLYNDIDNSNFNFIQLSLYNLFFSCNDIHSPDIFLHDTAKEIRMHQSRQEHIFLSNKLIPSCEHLVKELFRLTQNSYRLTILKSNKL